MLCYVVRVRRSVVIVSLCFVCFFVCLKAVIEMSVCLLVVMLRVLLWFVFVRGCFCLSLFVL